MSPRGRGTGASSGPHATSGECSAGRHRWGQHGSMECHDACKPRDRPRKPRAAINRPTHDAAENPSPPGAERRPAEGGQAPQDLPCRRSSRHPPGGGPPHQRGARPHGVRRGRQRPACGGDDPQGVPRPGDHRPHAEDHQRHRASEGPEGSHAGASRPRDVDARREPLCGARAARGRQGLPHEERGRRGDDLRDPPRALGGAPPERSREGEDAWPPGALPERRGGLLHGQPERPRAGGVPADRQRPGHAPDRREAQPEREDDRLPPGTPEGEAPARNGCRSRPPRDTVDEGRGSAV